MPEITLQSRSPHLKVTGLKLKRLTLHMSQVEFSKLLGINVQDVYRLENGRMTPSPSQLRKLEAVFGLDAAALLNPVAESA